MKGIVFTTFSDMVEEQFGLATWEALLDKVNPSCGGSYTAGATYEDAELMALISELAQLTSIPIPQLIEAFGIYMFPVLANKYPVFIQQNMSLKEFLKSINDIIHVEVKKLYPEAGLPLITYEDPADNQLIMLYRSPRKLCYLAIGLSKGAATYFKNNIVIKHPICMHNGADHCRLEMTITKAG